MRDDEIDGAAAAELLRVSGPMQIERDLNTLHGILAGIGIDGAINQAEAAALSDWCRRHSASVSMHPFNVLVPMIERATEDGVLDLEERQDIASFIGSLSSKSSYFDVSSSDMQKLHGMLAGIASDGVIREQEACGVMEWLLTVRHLTGSWPYDVTVRLLRSVLRDGVIDKREHAALMAFCDSFAKETANLLTKTQFDEQFVRAGICEEIPNVSFPGKTFCITGESLRCKRAKIVQCIESLGAQHKKSVAKDVDYLVLCGGGSQAWAFATYGRKVESAMMLKNAGLPIAIVDEDDLWQAVAEAGGTCP